MLEPNKEKLWPTRGVGQKVNMKPRTETKYGSWTDGRKIIRKSLQTKSIRLAKKAWEATEERRGPAGRVAKNFKVNPTRDNVAGM